MSSINAKKIKKSGVLTVRGKAPSVPVGGSGLALRGQSNKGKNSYGACRPSGGAQSARRRVSLL